MLILEGMQAGLSWLTILNKREAFRIAFDNFDCKKVALYDDAKIEELWLSKKVGIFVTVILNAGLGSVLGIFTATTSLWMICPYSWVPHLMISVLGILPNGEPVADQSTAMAFWMIILVLVISLAWFAALSFLTARWFEKKEVG